MGRIGNNYDVVIVGAGILGCSAANALASRNLRVALLDAGAIGSGTSSATFGWINGTSKSSDRQYFELNAAGLKLYAELAEQWGAANIGLHQSGMIEWSHPGDPGKLRELRSACERLGDWAYPVEWLDNLQLRQAEPGIQFEAGAEGYLAVEDCWLDVPAYLKFLRGRLSAARGVGVFENCRALALEATEEGRVRGVHTEQGCMACDHVIVATGPRTPEVLSELTGYTGYSSRFPMKRGPGVLVNTPVCTGVRVRHVMYSSHPSGFHFRADGSGGLLVAADDTDGLLSEAEDAKDMDRAMHLLLARTEQFVTGFYPNQLAGRCKTAIGVRAVPVDGRSIAGPALAAPGLHIILTHSGITLAPVLAKLVAEAIASDRVPDELRPFLIDRFDDLG